MDETVMLNSYDFINSLLLRQKPAFLCAEKIVSGFRHTGVNECALCATKVARLSAHSSVCRPAADGSMEHQLVDEA
jgi:hypothetical protein